MFAAEDVVYLGRKGGPSVRVEAVFATELGSDDYLSSQVVGQVTRHM
jgi:hypothetical protein